MLPGSAKTYRYKYLSGLSFFHVRITTILLHGSYALTLLSHSRTAATFPHCCHIPHCCYIPALLSHPALLPHSRTAVASRTAVSRTVVTLPARSYASRPSFISCRIIFLLKVICIIMAVLAPIGSCYAIASVTARWVMMVSWVSFLWVTLTNIRTAVSIIGISCSTTLFLEHSATQVWKAMSSSM